MEKLFFLMIALALVCCVGCIGRKRKIGFGWAFFLSIINLVLGLVVTLCSKKKDVDFVDMKKEEE